MCMAHLFSCFVCKKQIAANSSDDADSDNIRRQRPKPVSPRNSTGGGKKSSSARVGGKRGEDNKLEGGRNAGGGNHRKSNSLSNYPGAGGGRHSGQKGLAVARAVIEEESFIGSPQEWMNKGGGGGGGGRKSASRNGEEESFVAEDNLKYGGGARKSANGRMEEVEESFVAGDDWNYRGGGKNNIKFSNNKGPQRNFQGKKSPARQLDEDIGSFAAGSPRTDFEASSFSRNWEKSQTSVSLSEWAIVCRSNADK